MAVPNVARVARVVVVLGPDYSDVSRSPDEELGGLWGLGSIEKGL